MNRQRKWQDAKRRDYEKIDGINISGLCRALEWNGKAGQYDIYMARTRHYLDNPTEPTRAMILGSATHYAVYEPAEFVSRVVDFVGTRRGAAWEAFKLANTDKLILYPDDMAECLDMRRAVMESEFVGPVLRCEGQTEVAVEWLDERTGLKCKGRVDRLTSLWGRPCVHDFKTAAAASRSAFKFAIRDNAYHVRAAWYLDGLDANGQAMQNDKPVERLFVWPVVEKSAPYLTALYMPSPEMLNDGRRVYRALLDAYALSVKTNIWNGYQTSTMPQELDFNSLMF